MQFSSRAKTAGFATADISHRERAAQEARRGSPARGAIAAVVLGQRTASGASSLLLLMHCRVQGEPTVKSKKANANLLG